MRVKKDTLEFNASSFKVRPDANVEILLKQLANFGVDNEISLNESIAKQYRESTATNFTNLINFNKTLEKKARTFSFEITITNSSSLNLLEIIFNQGNKPNDQRNQNNKTDNVYNSYSADIEYTEPITDSLRLRIGPDFEWTNTINDVKTLDVNAIPQSYSNLNDLQTNFTTSNQNSIALKAGITFEKNNFTFNLNSSTSIIAFDNHSLYLNKITDLNQTIKREAYLLRYGLIINGGYCLDKGFTIAFLCNAKSVVFSPKVYFSYEYGDLLTVALSYGLS